MYIKIFCCFDGVNRLYYTSSNIDYDHNKHEISSPLQGYKGTKEYTAGMELWLR